MALLEANKENTEENVMLCGRIAEDAVDATKEGSEEIFCFGTGDIDSVCLVINNFY